MIGPPIYTCTGRQAGTRLLRSHIKHYNAPCSLFPMLITQQSPAAVGFSI